MVSDPAWATKYSTTELVELSGTQGAELLNWLVARGTLPEGSRQQANYHNIGADEKAGKHLRRRCFPVPRLDPAVLNATSALVRSWIEACRG
jgi:hypothetical protein